MTLADSGAFDGNTSARWNRLDKTRTVVAIGDPARERLVLQVIAESVDDGPPLTLVRRCLDADELHTTLQLGEVDAAIVSADLHGLTIDALRAAVEFSIPLVLWDMGGAASLATEIGAPHLTVLPHGVDVSDLRGAIRGVAIAAGRLRRTAASTRRSFAARRRAVIDESSRPPVPVARSVSVRGTVLALVGPPGGHGVSVLAAGLTAALSRTASAALVDLNLALPSQALALDLNPARNLYMILHEVGEHADDELWAKLLESELQALDSALPRASVLAGVPGQSHAKSVGATTVSRLLEQLARQARFVVVDVGSDLTGHGSIPAAHRAALEHADCVYVVARSDLVGLRRAAHLLESLRGLIDHHEHRLALILNRHNSRHHHDPVEVARALRTTVAAVVPDDPGAALAALAAQRPIVGLRSTRRSSAARALLDLAASIEQANGTRAHVTDRRPRPGLSWPGMIGGLAWQSRRT